MPEVVGSAAGDRQKTLVGILGLTAALGVMVATPALESSRTVSARATASGHVQLTHLSGRQYLHAYKDVVGVWTACDGIAGVKPGSTFTEAQCDAMLEAALTSEAEHVMACTPGLRSPGHDNQRIAAVLLTHNIGWPHYCGSTVRARFNARQYAAGCDAFLMWKFAGGRPVLLARRQRERAICLKDVH